MWKLAARHYLLPMPAITPLGPGVEEESGDGGPSSASNSGDATHEGQRAVINSSSGPWTDAEWEEWRARRRTWYSWPQQLLPPLVEMDQLLVAVMPVRPWGASANREDDGMGAATKSACLNSQVGMTKTAW